MVLRLAELEAKIKELRPQLYDNSPITVIGNGPVVDAQLAQTGNGRKSLQLMCKFDPEVGGLNGSD